MSGTGRLQGDRGGATALTWIRAAGPPLVLVIVLQAGYGLAVARYAGPLDPLRAWLTVVLFAFDAVGRRLVNDYEDHRRGLDRPGDVRPDSSLALQLDMRQVRRVGMASFAVAWVLAAYLALTTSVWALLLAAVCYVAYFTYAGGPRPLGHRGFGEVVDLLVTGTAVTVLVVWVNAGGVDPVALVACTGPGFLFAALMLHNNARDVHKDAAAGKTTLPQLVGATATKVGYVGSVTGFYAVTVAVALAQQAPWQALPLLTLPWFVWLAARFVRAPRLGPTLVDWSHLYFIMILAFALFSAGAWLSVS